MEQKTLHIENFGPITDATVELRAFNMFIGEQSIGKSTMAKLIAIFTDYVSLCKLVKDKEVFWEETLDDFGMDIYQDNPYRIVYDMEQDDRLFHIEISRGKVSYRLVQGDVPIIDPKQIINMIMKLKKIYHAKEVQQKVAKSGNTQLKKQEILELFSNSLYIPAERIIYSVVTNLMPALFLSKSAIPQILLRFMVELNNAKAEYPKFPIELLNVDFKYEAGEDSIVFGEKGEAIPLSVASSGIQSLVPLVLVLHFAINKREYSSFVIEEPECNLFPTKQVELLKNILRLVRHSSRTLTITTHSPYLLSALNNILFADMIIKKYGPESKNLVDEILQPEYRLSADECSVYSLGKEINRGVYCKSLLDSETGMIDFNSLDAVSEQLSMEFDALQNAVISLNIGE